jgi:hypothetical protein
LSFMPVFHTENVYAYVKQFCYVLKKFHYDFLLT